MLPEKMPTLFDLHLLLNQEDLYRVRTEEFRHHAQGNAGDQVTKAIHLGDGRFNGAPATDYVQWWQRDELFFTDNAALSALIYVEAVHHPDEEIHLKKLFARRSDTSLDKIHFIDYNLLERNFLQDLFFTVN